MGSKKLHCVDEVERFHEALKEEFRRAGRGSIGRVTQSLGLWRNFYAHHREQVKMDLGTLLATLDEIPVDRVEFFTRVLRQLEEKGRPVEAMTDSDEEIRGADPLNLVRPVAEIAYRRAAEELEVEIDPEELEES